MPASGPAVWGALAQPLQRGQLGRHMWLCPHWYPHLPALSEHMGSPRGGRANRQQDQTLVGPSESNSTTGCPCFWAQCLDPTDLSAHQLFEVPSAPYRLVQNGRGYSRATEKLLSGASR